MSILRRFKILLKAANQMGLPSLGLYARYQIGLRSGYYRWVTPTEKYSHMEKLVPWVIVPGMLVVPSPESLKSVCGADLSNALTLANEIIAGQVHLFGGLAVPLELIPPLPLAHWTSYETGKAKSIGTDIKWIWEPARFGWAITLAQAYLVSSNEHYAQAFWRYSELFFDSNPPYLGPNWRSSQEVALRLISLAFSIQVFCRSPHTTPDRLQRLSQIIAAHARRIPPTLVYARAQNNNHLLSEAAGLMTAGRALPKHPQSERWGRLGRRLFIQAIGSQIAEDGSYIQHSTNYHRLMLQVALWVHALGESLPEESTHRLAAATLWLIKLVDPEKGGVPNLGPNDGAYILPLSACPFSDFRPTLQAASRVFLGHPSFPPGPWDDMALWFSHAYPDQDINKPPLNEVLKPTLPRSPELLADSPHKLQNPNHPSWAYLRVARFTSRPGHADQLHLDLWWRGINIAMDAGTFSYNDPPPWDNALSSTHVHNTITIDGKDQMDCAGRFLWLDWAQAEVISRDLNSDGSIEQIVARHNGYQHIGVLHQRKVTTQGRGVWRIIDQLLPVNPHDVSAVALRSRQYSARLHWLLPDWPWELALGPDNTHVSFHLEFPIGIVQLNLSTDPTSILSQPKIQVVRAGKIIHGNGSFETTWGWVSPTYQSKFPALSIAFQVDLHLPAVVNTEWILPGSV